jgi:hypothetical protein
VPRWLCAVLLAALPACVSVGGGASAPPPAAVAPEPALAAVTAPAAGRILDEIDALGRFGRHPGAQLRIAWLLQEQGSWEESMTVLNQILFGPAPSGGAAERPGPDVAALARYLRARTFAHRGETARAADERAQALETVLAPDLRSRLLAEGGGPTPAAPRGGVAVPTPTILPRSSWKAASARTAEMRRMGVVKRITVHHSATLVRSTSTAAAVGAIRGIQRHHQGENGWGDIGYHFLIDPAGRVWTGRALDWQGAHAGDPERNQFNVGICLLGNFVRSGQGAPAPAQLQALDGLCTALCLRYGVEARNVLTHQELKTTDCPGPYVQAAVEDLRERLRGRLLAARPGGG